MVSTVYDGAGNDLQQLDSFQTQIWYFRRKLELSERQTQTWIS